MVIIQSYIFGMYISIEKAIDNMEKMLKFMNYLFLKKREFLNITFVISELHE